MNSFLRVARLKQYQLTNKDFRELWMYASPQQIKDEFGDRVPSERTIYRRLRQYNLSGIKAHEKKLMTRILDKTGGVIPLRDLKAQLEEEKFVQREAIFIEIWNKIKDYEAAF